MGKETKKNKYEIQNSAIAEFFASIYRKQRLKVEKRAKNIVDTCNPDIQEDMIKDNIRRYKILNALAGVLGPFCFSVLIVLWPRPSGTELYFGFQALTIYVISVLVVGLLIIYLIIRPFLIKDVWEHLWDAREKDERDSLKNKLDELSKTYDALLNTNAVQDERLSLIAYLDDNPNNNPIECLVKRIHSRLGSGEYSVGVYIADKNNYTLAEYTESRLSGDRKPSAYKRVLKGTGSKHKKYHFFKCLYENEKGMHCFFDKKDINKDSFDGDFQDINQYVCYWFKKDREYNLLLEIIAYNNSTFDKLSPTREKFFKNLFLAYVPVFTKYVSAEVIKEKYKVIS